MNSLREYAYPKTKNMPALANKYEKCITVIMNI